MQQCKAELTRESTVREKASQAEIAHLQAELAKQTKKTEEAEKKYKNAESFRVSSHDEQQVVLVRLQNEVKEWKEKYEKLNKKVKKVQNIMSDD